VEAVFQAVEEEEEKNKIPIRTAAEARQLRFEKLAQPKLPDAPPPPPKPVSADTRRAPSLGVSLADCTEAPAPPGAICQEGTQNAESYSEATPEGVAMDLTSPPNATANELAAFPPAADASGCTVIDSPLQ
jgi:hypothetical protein